MATKKTLVVPPKAKPVVQQAPTSTGNVPTTHNLPNNVLSTGNILPDLQNPPTDTALPAEMNISASTMQWAVDTAEILNDDPDFGPDMVDYWQSADKVKKGPAIMAQDLMGTFGIEKLREFPIVGLKLKDMNKNDPRNGEEYPTVTVGKDGVTKNSTGNKYKDLVSRLSWVQEEQKWVDYWTKVIEAPATINEVHRSRYPNKAARSGQLEKHKAHVASAYTMIRNAMRVIIAMDKLSNSPLIGCEFRMVQATQIVHTDPDDDSSPTLERPVFINPDTGEATFEVTSVPHKVLTDARKCITCWNKATTGGDWQGDDYHIGGFLQFDVDEALKNGGTYEALVATAKREVEAPTTQLPDVKNKTRADFLINLARYFKEGNHTELLLADLAKGKLSGEELVAIEALRGELDVITNASEFTTAINKIKKEHDGRSTLAWLQRKAA